MLGKGDEVRLGRAVTLALAAVAIAACMDRVGAPSQPGGTTAPQATIIAHSLVLGGKQALEVTERASFSATTREGHTAFSPTRASADSTWVPAVPQQVLKAARSSAASSASTRRVHGRIVARKTVNGRLMELVFADTDGYNPKDPPHMVLLTANGIPRVSFLPRYRKSGGRFVPTGGVYNLYDSTGALLQSTDFQITADGRTASRPTRRGGILDALAIFSAGAFLPRAAFAQTYDQPSCASDASMGVLDTVLLIGEGASLIGSAALALDLFGMLECAGGGVPLPPVYITCPACTTITTSAWVCDPTGNACFEQYSYEQYCPPC